MVRLADYVWSRGCAGSVYARPISSDFMNIALEAFNAVTFASYEREAEIMAYLDARELVTNVYERRLVPLELLESRRTVQAWAYVARLDHDQYCGGADEAVILEMVRKGCGSSGTCQEYLVNTLDHLSEMGIQEPDLEALARRLDGDPGVDEPPAAASGSHILGPS